MSSSSIKDIVKEHFVLIAGITLPLALIVIFSLARMVTDAAVDAPQYKAVYAQLDPGTYVNGKFSYQINDGRLNVSWTGPQPYQGQPAQPQPVMARTNVIIFDPVSGQRSQYVFEAPNSQLPGTVPVTGQQLPPLTLIPGDQAPDGYTYNSDTYRYQRRGIFNEVFGGSRYYDERYTIGKDGKTILLPLQDRYSQFTFIGWAK